MFPPPLKSAALENNIFLKNAPLSPSSISSFGAAASAKTEQNKR